MNKAAVARIFELAPRVSAAVAAQPAYAPGEQPGGEGWIKLNTNENPFPPSPRVVEAIRRELGGDGAVLRLYPSPASDALREAVARFHGVDVACAFAGNGSDDVLNLLVRAFSGGGMSVGMLEPSYSLYPVLAGLNAAATIRVPVSLEGEFDVDAVCRCGANIFFLTNPNAPLGVAFAPEKIAAVLACFDGLLVVDEAYAPFARADATGLLGEFPNLVITRTFSKAYALAGMRVGYALAHRDVVAVLDKVRDSYNVDRLAQVSAVAALGDRAYYDGVIAHIREVRDATADALRRRGWRVLPSEANFLMAAPPVGADAVFRFLKERRVLVRHFPQNPLTAPFLRISVGSGDEMLKFLNIIDQWTP